MRPPRLRIKIFFHRNLKILKFCEVAPLEDIIKMRSFLKSASKIQSEVA